ncbi:Thyrotropin-releasing hormone-degrading ectoenzyme, partial [Varanus komodoensis]
MQDYLTIHKYGNAARKDLWNTLSEALKKVGKFVNIQEVMDQWTLQMGYPVITIMGNETSDNVVRISQEHFIYDLHVKTKDLGLGNNSYLWQIPLTIAVGNTSHISPEAIIWVSNKSELGYHNKKALSQGMLFPLVEVPRKELLKVTLESVWEQFYMGGEHHRIASFSEGNWLLGNINQTGYFRVNYDIRNWRLLIDQLMRNHKVISVSNRASLIDDAFNLA